MVAILMIFAPIAIWLISVQMIFVVPKFKEVTAGMGVATWPLAQFVFSIAPELVLLEALLFFTLAAAATFYIGGPGLVRWFQFREIPLVDWIAWRVPWKQKKLLRTFSAMLAVLLDGGVPEPEAVRLAGESTANEICRRRAKKVIDELTGGTKLVDAVRAFDATGEFHWRMANGAHSRGNFLDALRGWHEALDVKAFQQEDAATHAVTSGMVILNGVVVGLIATAMFGILITVLKGGLEL